MIFDMRTYDDYGYITKMTSNRLDILIYSHSQSGFQMVFVEIRISTKTIQGDGPKWSPENAGCFFPKDDHNKNRLVQWYPPLTWHSLTSYSQWNKQNMKLGMVHFWLSNHAKAKCFMSGPMSNYIWLVVYLPLWKKSQLGLSFPIYGNIKFMFRTTNQNMVKS